MTNAKVQVLASNPNKVQKEDTVVIKDTPKESGFLSSSTKTEINWFHTAMLTGIPAIALYGLFTTTIQLNTFVLAVIMYFWTGLGITAGYHRLWSHRAFQATWIVRFLLCLGGAAAFEGSAKWWCRNHRAHHRYTDTEKDPYNAKRGFFYSHLGWMLTKQKVKDIGFANITDLQKDPMIVWQHRFYLWISLTIGVALPVAIGSLWGDARGAYFYAVAARVFFVHHATFFVNSLAHTLGDKTFSDLHTAFDSFITAILTLGEGYHNYHHEFPSDYRNGIRVYHYDPTKWLIKGLSLFGLTYNLKCMSEEEIEKARLQMQQRHLDQEKAKISYGKKFDKLPSLSWDDVNKRVTNGEKLVVIDNIVHDVASFVHEHPGGRQTLLNYVGTDATEFFEGREGLHTHSKEARKYLFAMRIGSLDC
jgi:stearoyl-CoA desaturase (delta-9 desaturase)